MRAACRFCSRRVITRLAFRTSFCDINPHERSGDLLCDFAVGSVRPVIVSNGTGSVGETYFSGSGFANFSGRIFDTESGTILFPQTIEKSLYFVSDIIERDRLVGERWAGSNERGLLWRRVLPFQAIELFQWTVVLLPVPDSAIQTRSNCRYLLD